MTALSKVSQWISPEEYLEGERFSDVRHEYIDGAVYGMAGASDDHNRITGNIFYELSNQLRSRKCEAFINDMKVKISRDSSLFYYPDVLVACDPEDNAQYFRERPSVIFEVVSPETERTDRREKLLGYQAIPTVTSYVIVEQEQIAAIVFRRVGPTWKTESLNGKKAVLRLPEIGVEFKLDRIYERTTRQKAGKKLRTARHLE